MLEELDKICASEELIQETLEFCRLNGARILNENNTTNKVTEKLTRHVSKLAVATAACLTAVIAVSGAALAYNAVTGESIIDNVYKLANRMSYMNNSKGVTDADGNSYIYDGMVNVNQALTDKNITVSLTSYVVDGNNADIFFTVKTIDGSPLLDTTEDKVPNITFDKFNDFAVTVNDNELATSLENAVHETTGEQTARDVDYLDSAVELNPGELHIEFSDGRIMFRYLAKADSTYYGDEYSAIITMKNGTTFYADEGGCEAGWEVKENVGQSWWAAWKLATYINPADVASVTWHGTTLYQAK